MLARTVIVPPPELGAGKRPDEAMLPRVLDQAIWVSGGAVAVNCCWPPGAIVTLFGLMVTAPQPQKWRARTSRPAGSELAWGMYTYCTDAGLVATSPHSGSFCCV